ncbi:TPA: hypothetical protein QDB48_003665 [Burkholderia vietnamiensis]|nr:hypothetical protein [Burkholderia vietnamiensis]HDR9202326.1 hypothetical protein [Burkholderia vietnamiensis]
MHDAGLDFGGGIDRLVLGRAFVAAIQPQRVELHDRIHGRERALLPLLDVGQHLAGGPFHVLKMSG